MARVRPPLPGGQCPRAAGQPSPANAVLCAVPGRRARRIDRPREDLVSCFLPAIGTAPEQSRSPLASLAALKGFGATITLLLCTSQVNRLAAARSASGHVDSGHCFPAHRMRVRGQQPLRHIRRPCPARSAKRIQNHHRCFIRSVGCGQKAQHGRGTRNGISPWATTG